LTPEDEPSTHRTLQTGNPHQSNGSSGVNDQQSGPIMEVQIGPRGPVTHPVIPATDERPPPINHGFNYQQNMNPGMNRNTFGNICIENIGNTR
jgi:hypothetical protein